MKHEKDCAIEIREVDGALKLFVHTDLQLWTDYRKISDLKGTPVLNPLDGFRIFQNTNKSWEYIDRNDIEIMWGNAKGETSKTFADVAIPNDDGEPDAWFVAKIVTSKLSEFSNSMIGSSHWFRTLISEHSRIGEFLENNDNVDPKYLKSWGERIHNSSKELLKWSDKSKILTSDNE